MTMEENGVIYTPDMVLGEPRKGLKVTYTTDTRPVQAIIDHAKDSDVFICEGMYGEHEKAEKAKEYRHMTMQEAAHLASEADVKEMWLTHFSPSTSRPDWYLKEIQNIFPDTVIGRDGMTKELKFRDGED